MAALEYFSKHSTTQLRFWFRVTFDLDS